MTGGKRRPPREREAGVACRRCSCAVRQALALEASLAPCRGEAWGPMPARPIPYHPAAGDEVLAFFARVFAELGHDFDPASKDRDLADIPTEYPCAGGGFWMVRDGDDGPVVGTIALRRLGEDAAELKRFYVREAWQGRGLGKRLLETAIARAREQGIGRIRLDTTAKSAAAIRLFERRGFTAIGRVLAESRGWWMGDGG